MAYYTECHGMRRLVAKTYDITVEKYALLFQCCEKYYNIAWKYPAQCPDGQGCCGVDHEQFRLDLRYEIPTLYRDDDDCLAIPMVRFDTEFQALTKIGNNFRIRHHETDKVEITDVRHYDYFFNRFLSLIALALQYLE